MNVSETIKKSGQEALYAKDVIEKPLTYSDKDCLKDSQFQAPYIDIDEWRDVPVYHRYVHGGFAGTQNRFSFYYPPKEKYQGRFYQRMMPVQGDEKIAQKQSGEEDIIRFAVTHGAYFIDTNMGGIVNGGGDFSLVYRSSGAAAEYSRQLAREMYGCERPYGYVFGGSGGGYKTISCLESTEGIWDGGVPFVIGSPMAMPNMFTIRAHCMRLLRNRFAEIKDALEPGGSGDPYAVLSKEEQEALREAQRMGFPLDTWCEYDTIGEGALPVLYPAIPQIDPSYFQDFWEKEGYLGSKPGNSALRDRIKLETTIKSIIKPRLEATSIADTIDETNAYGVDEAWKNQIAKGKTLPVFSLAEFPQTDVYERGLTLCFLSGELEGQVFNAAWLGHQLVTVEMDGSGRPIEQLLHKAKAGDFVRLDNSDYIAVQTYHRHQVPGKEYTAWNQFRDAEGNPLYPQRPMLVGPILAMSGAGALQNGDIHGKVIILESLMDESAFPWNADWYRGQIDRNCGLSKEDGSDHEKLRLYYMEHCMHTDCEEGNGGDHQHIVSYLGALYQALLDLADWVEHGIEPLPSSEYQIDEGCVLIADNAAARKGIQPVLKLTATAKSASGLIQARSGAGISIPEGKLTVSTGTPVNFKLEVQIPKDAGLLEEVTWSPEGTDDFIPCTMISETEVNPDSSGKAFMECQYTFPERGTYFPVIRAAINRRHEDVFTRVRNLVRIRILVE